MVVSNEPGYYEDGAFGIRIENLLVIREQPTPHRFGGQAYLGFERLTLCPLQRKMIALEVRPPCSRACLIAASFKNDSELSLQRASLSLLFAAPGQIRTAVGGEYRSQWLHADPPAQTLIRVPCAQLLSDRERAWVDGYHAQVWDAVAPRLAGRESSLGWLRTHTAPLPARAPEQALPEALAPTPQAVAVA